MTFFRWKLFDETKRGGSFVKAAWETTEKDIQGNVSNAIISKLFEKETVKLCG